MVRHVSLAGRFSDAVAYAAVAHAGQVRKGTDTPYLSHLLAVAALVLEHGGDEVQATAGVLHDVVEDCGGLWRLEDVRVVFGEQMASLVGVLSDDAPVDGAPKAPWKQRKEAYLAELRELVGSDHPAALVSLCDKLHNARAIVADASDEAGPGPRFGIGLPAPLKSQPGTSAAWLMRSVPVSFLHGRSSRLMLLSMNFAGWLKPLRSQAIAIDLALAMVFRTPKAADGCPASGC